MGTSTRRLPTIHSGVSPGLHVLISYRADLEGRIGSFWQNISGSPLGLARVYLGGIDPEMAWSGIEESLADLTVPNLLTSSEGRIVIEALRTASAAVGVTGIYPPYLQMLIDHMWAVTRGRREGYKFSDYSDAGGVDGIVGGFLTRQLAYVNDDSGNIRLVITALVRSYGVKAQRTLPEIVAESGLSPAECESALEKLIDLRLVRHVGDQYEISHDFLARRIANELVDAAEREFKRFRELFASKAAAFGTTDSKLTTEEQLALFKHRRRIIPTEPELHLLLASWLEGTGPGLYWLLSDENAPLTRRLTGSLSRSDMETEKKVSFVLLCRKLSGSGLTREDFAALKSYQAGAELAHLISRDPLALDPNSLLASLRHQRAEVRSAARDAVAKRLARGEWSLLAPLRNSASAYFRSTYYAMIVRSDVPAPQIADSDRAVAEFYALKCIMIGRLSYAELAHLLRSRRAGRKIMLLARSLSRWREGDPTRFLRQVMRFSRNDTPIALAAIGSELSQEQITALIRVYLSLNLKEDDASATLGANNKAAAISEKIRAAARGQNILELRAAFPDIRLTQSARSIVLTLLEHGTAQDLEQVLRRIAACESRIDFWNHTEFGLCMLRRANTDVVHVPSFLRTLLSIRELWEYISLADRRSARPEDLLPIANIDNRPLFIRLVLYAAIAYAGQQDIDYLLKSLHHGYTFIARAAAVKLVRTLGQDAFVLMDGQIDGAFLDGSVRSLAVAIRYAEMDFHDVGRFW